MDSLSKDEKFKVLKCDCFLTYNGRKLHEDELPPTGAIIRVHPKLIGGKGGFGSMLRAIGARIEKTTNHEACRDLSGRRMRDVNNEKKISEWLQEQESKEKEKTQRHQERIERTLNPKMKYEDKDYTISLQGNVEKINEAIKFASVKGKNAKAGDKRKSTEKADTSKKPKLWLGLDGLSDEDSEASETASDIEEEDIVKAEEITTPDQPKDNSNSEKLDKNNQYTQGTSDNSTNTRIPGEKHEIKKSKPEFLNLDEFKNAEELQAVGLERLKSALMFHGMKCGGSLQQRAERLFLTKHTPIEQLDSSLFVKDLEKDKS